MLTSSRLSPTESVFAHMQGNTMNTGRMTCKCCGKRSGLDNMVHNAAQIGIHGKAFMVDVLVDGPKGQSPAHAISCSQCGETFDGMAYWLEEGNWRGD